MLTCLLSLATIVFVAAKPGDPPPPADSPSAKSQDTTDANGETIVMPRRRKPIVPDPARLSKALPEEREAVRAAIVAEGGEKYNERGRVNWISCEIPTDADVKLFAALPDLEYLHIGPPFFLTGSQSEGYHGPPKVDDAGLATLYKVRKLRTLAIVDTQVTNECLKVVGQLTNLRSLVLGSTGITGAGMGHLDGLKRLEVLNLRDSMVGDDGMRSVGTHVTLKQLRLNSSVSAKGLAELVRLTSLEVIWIDRRLNDEDMRFIGQLRNLRVLKRGLFDLTETGLRSMKDMKRLQSLDLENTAATDAGMVYVAQMSGLECLFLSPRISDAGVSQLSGLAGLKTLGLSGAKVTDEALKNVKTLAELRTLWLSDTRVTARGIAQLRGMKKLERVGVSGTGISDYDSEELNSIGIPVKK
jgi:hypothetical protein